MKFNETNSNINDTYDDLDFTIKVSKFIEANPICGTRAYWMLHLKYIWDLYSNRLHELT